MEELNNPNTGSYNEQTEEGTAFSLRDIYVMFLLNWKWFAASVIVCLAVAYTYLHYATPHYQTTAKLLIKDEEQKSRSNSINQMMNSATFGMINNSYGIDNEVEILCSRYVAEQALTDLRLYVAYTMAGRVKDHIIYKTQPVSVSFPVESARKLKAPIDITITRADGEYHIEGTYYKPLDDDDVEGPYTFKRDTKILPAVVALPVGKLTFAQNHGRQLKDGQKLYVNIVSPKDKSYEYAAKLTVAPTSKNTTIAQLNFVDENKQRAVDYIKELVVCYNNRANEDKNLVAMRTEAFINDRLEKISAELGDTEGKLESYKRSNNMVELKINATQSVANANTYEQKLADANMQVQLIDEMQKFMKQPENRYQTLPTNIGMTDPVSVQLIGQYNTLVLERSHLLQSAAEHSPTITPLTRQLDDLAVSIRQAMADARKNVEIMRNGVAREYARYQGLVSQTPSQERVLTQIARQQDVKSGLYLMLLQKREENAISLAATADKSILIDYPDYSGRVGVKASMVMLVAFILGLGIPFGILLLLRMLKTKIEGHEDVEKLTKMPIIADVARAKAEEKNKAEIVVRENQNSQMDETFRTLRTNLKFVLKETDKVVLCTSSTSGEGKTFVASNLAMSFALLQKKVLLIGLDIRKPRLGDLFSLRDRHLGISRLLAKDAPTLAEIQEQIQPSGVNDNLELLTAGPIPPNPTELLARQSLDHIIATLRGAYDMIIIDSAPVGLVIDTLQIGRVSDATIYVCRADYTPRAFFELANQLATEKKLPNMNVVINDIDMSQRKYGYQYGYKKYGSYHYDNYYGHDKKQKRY